MAMTNTTTAAAVLSTDQFVTLTSATGLLAGMFLKIDDEYMLARQDYGIAGSAFTSTVVPVVRRGDRSSVQSAHSALAVVTFGLITDLANYAPGTLTQDSNDRLGTDIVTYSVSGAIAIPVRDTIVVLDKAGVAVMTLAAPGKDQDGLKLTITSTTAQAHTITATSLIADGASGSPHTTVTFTTGYKGQGLTLQALQGLWQLVANVATTIS